MLHQDSISHAPSLSAIRSSVTIQLSWRYFSISFGWRSRLPYPFSGYCGVCHIVATSTPSASKRSSSHSQSFSLFSSLSSRSPTTCKHPSHLLKLNMLVAVEMPCRAMTHNSSLNLPSSLPGWLFCTRPTQSLLDQLHNPLTCFIRNWALRSPSRADLLPA